MKASTKGTLLVWAMKVLARFFDVRLSGEEHVHACLREGRPVLFAGWHGHNFLTMGSFYMHLSHLFKGAAIMVPGTENGEVMERFGQGIGIDVIKVNAELGASQWARATISLIKLIRGGHCAMISPD